MKGEICKHNDITYTSPISLENDDDDETTKRREKEETGMNSLTE